MWLPLWLIFHCALRDVVSLLLNFFVAFVLRNVVPPMVACSLCCQGCSSPAYFSFIFFSIFRDVVSPVVIFSLCSKGCIFPGFFCDFRDVDSPVFFFFNFSRALRNADLFICSCILRDAVPPSFFILLEKKMYKQMIISYSLFLCKYEDNQQMAQKQIFSATSLSNVSILPWHCS